MLAAFARHALVAATLAMASAPASPWRPDRGDGSYRNPVLFADYSDPDVVRDGDDFYLVASSFSSVPALPILHSRDLVDWTIVGHAAARLPSPDFDTPQHGKGIWAPSFRHHDGYFWIYVGDPDRGVYMTRARDPRGPWEPLHLLQPARGWIDPCPLWDDDGSMYLVHAWAKSRAGFNGVLSVRRLTPDGRAFVGEETRIFDGGARHPTIEGPKLYKRDGWYYVFAPAGGVADGWQTVLRSRNVLGPYEDRIVLDRGGTATNGPHQGAWVTTPTGDWFLHFQDRGAYGRIVHLQPLAWRDGWPVIGRDDDGDGRGEPVAGGTKPLPGAGAREPQTSDAFDGDRLSLQWQWQANPRADWFSLAARPGFLRLAAVAAAGPNHWASAHLLLQKLPAPAFTATARLDPAGLREGERAGLIVMGADYATLTVERAATGAVLRLRRCHEADKGAAETEDAAVPVPADALEVRVAVGEGAVCLFSWRRERRGFEPIGPSFVAQPGRWVGAKVGLFASAAGPGPAGHADVDWFRVE
jgi:beta-xylosidase